jgi:uncharacterized protein YaiL (DUF2058 family)
LKPFFQKSVLSCMADEKEQAERAAHEARVDAARAERSAADASREESEAADRRADEAEREAGL